MEPRYCPKNNGFSLVELVIAVAILSIGITAILQALSFSARVAVVSCDMVDAAFLVEDKMQEVFYAGQNLPEEKKLEVFNRPDTKDKFILSPELILDPVLNLYKYKLRTSWERANRKEELEVNTYLRK